ncbi:MAG: hypothetical protein IPI73_24765 [Betaproteobacteria bacterium]|nr:hypothetical protein [Betaproteobacteria bacterium]
MSLIRWLGKTERLTRLINQILDLSKLESGTTEWRETSVDLKEVIESTITATSQLLKVVANGRCLWKSRAISLVAYCGYPTTVGSGLSRCCEIFHVAG